MKIHRNLLVYILLALTVFSLFSCRIEENDGHNGIIISPEAEYSEETLTRAEKAIYTLLEHYAKRTATAELPPATLERIARVSGELARAIAEVPLSEELFLKLLDTFDVYGVDALNEMLDGTAEGENLKALYLEICSVAGQDYVGRSLYRIMTYALDYQYQKRISEYEKYGFQYLLDEANIISEDKEILTLEVGEENFVSFVRGAVSVSGLWLGGGFDTAEGANFTDEEILTFVSKIDLSLELSDRGWSVLLSRLSPLISMGDKKPFVDAALENGDVEKLASVMNSFTRLLSSVQSSLGVEEVRMLRAGERDELLSRVFGIFGDEEWALFESVTSIEVASEEYEHLCTEKYGVDFLEYKNSLNTVTLEELRRSVGGEKFYESLESYIGSISPALSYGMKK